MSAFRRTFLVVGLVLALAWVVRTVTASSGGAEQKEIETFNGKFLEVTLRMDNAGLMALWAEDGVSLLPGMAPMVSKKAIGTWLDDLVGKMAGYRVTKQ